MNKKLWLLISTMLVYNCTTRPVPMPEPEPKPDNIKIAKVIPPELIDKLDEEELTLKEKLSYFKETIKDAKAKGKKFSLVYSYTEEPDDYPFLENIYFEFCCNKPLDIVKIGFSIKDTKPELMMSRHSKAINTENNNYAFITDSNGDGIIVAEYQTGKISSKLDSLIIYDGLDPETSDSLYDASHFFSPGTLNGKLSMSVVSEDFHNIYAHIIKTLYRSAWIHRSLNGFGAE
ncbi:MAG: hypothetical protein ABH828_01715 [archaeon]